MKPACAWIVIAFAIFGCASRSSIALNAEAGVSTKPAGSAAPVAAPSDSQASPYITFRIASVRELSVTLPGDTSHLEMKIHVEHNLCIPDCPHCAEMEMCFSAIMDMYPWDYFEITAANDGTQFEPFIPEHGCDCSGPLPPDGFGGCFLPEIETVGASDPKAHASLFPVYVNACNVAHTPGANVEFRRNRDARAKARIRETIDALACGVCSEDVRIRFLD